MIFKGICGVKRSLNFLDERGWLRREGQDFIVVGQNEYWKL